MTTRHTLVIFVLAGLPATAVAQETVTYTLDWIEVLANSSMPVANPTASSSPARARVYV